MRVALNLIVLLGLSLCWGGCRSRSPYEKWTLQTFNQQLWHGDCNGSNIAATNDSIYFSGGYGWDDLVYLWNLDPITGRVKGKTGPYHRIHDIYSDGKILAYVVQNRDGRSFLEVKDLFTGNIRTELSTEIAGPPLFLGPSLWIVPTKQPGPNNKPVFEGWNIQNVNFRLFISPKPLGYGGVAVDGKLLTATLDGTLRAFSLTTGEVLYEKKFPGRFTTGLAVVGKYMVLAAKDGPRSFLIGFSRDDGEEIWRREIPDIVSTQKGSIAADEDRVYITANYKAQGIGIRAINPATGNIIWQQKSPVNGAITIAGKGVVLATRETLFVFDPATGEARLQAPLSDDTVSSPPGLREAWAYVATVDCRLHAFELPNWN